MRGVNSASLRHKPVRPVSVWVTLRYLLVFLVLYQQMEILMTSSVQQGVTRHSTNLHGQLT